LTSRNTAFYTLYFTAKFEQKSVTLLKIKCCQILKTLLGDPVS